MISHFEKLSSLRVAVLAGGPSAERDISLKSGAAVAAALRTRGHIVTEVDPLHTDLERFDWSATDVAFIALHGSFGEDGKVQTLLERAGVRYTGSGPAASELAFNKSAAKERFLQRAVPTPTYALIHESDDASRIQSIANTLGYPLVVKPNQQGSSLGVTIVESPEMLSGALMRCFHFDAFGILETAIEGTEWTQGVFDGELLPLLRIDPSRPFFDFDAKYEDEETGYIFDFDLPGETVAAIRDVAGRASDALGVTGVARVDLMLDRFGQPWVLEVNTVPGMTDHSLVPKAAARGGCDFAQLCERMLHATTAADRGRQRRAA